MRIYCFHNALNKSSFLLLYLHVHKGNPVKYNSTTFHMPFQDIIVQRDIQEIQIVISGFKAFCRGRFSRDSNDLLSVVRALNKFT